MELKKEYYMIGAIPIIALLIILFILKTRSKENFVKRQHVETPKSFQQLPKTGNIPILQRQNMLKE
jgi:hypothetical protein